MHQIVDLQFVLGEDGIYDLALGSDGDLATVNSFDTAILMTIFSERRADSSEIGTNYLRRGWWGNTLSNTPGFEMGSKLWLLSQARKTQDTVNKGVTYLQDAFKWFVDGNYAQSVEVVGEITREAIIFTVNIRVSENIVDAKNFDLWLNTVIGININVTN